MDYKVYLKTKGELNAEKKEKYEQSISAYRKLLENTEAFAELLGETMPDLPVEGMKFLKNKTNFIIIYNF
jgi:hypothetical protein